MKDYLLNFPSKLEAVQFGIQTGFVGFDENQEPVTTLATHSYAIVIIGPWIQTVGTEPDGTPIVKSDERHWVLFRDVTGDLTVPPGSEPYLHWRSDSGKPRPEDCPQDGWAGGDAAKVLADREEEVARAQKAKADLSAELLKKAEANVLLYKLEASK